MSEETNKLFMELGYDNLFFPFEDCFRNDRLVAYSHTTGDRIEIYNNPYPLKYNENTGKILKIYIEEARAISKAKKELNWDENIHLNYLLENKSKKEISNEL